MRITEKRIAKAEELAGYGRGGALSAAEVAELARLEAAEAIEHELITSGRMTGEQADEWLHRHSIGGDDGSSDRLAELRRRAMTPEQRAAEDAELARIKALSSEDLRAGLRERRLSSNGPDLKT